MCVRDRKSTRLNSSHITISYAVFCLKKKTTTAPSNHTGRSEERLCVSAGDGHLELHAFPTRRSSDLLDKSPSCCWEKGWLVGAVRIETSALIENTQLTENAHTLEC